jgi:hypothetical protein
MLSFNELIKRRGSQLRDILGGFSDDWIIEIQHKTQTDCPFSVPLYRTFSSFKPSALTSIDMIRQAIKDSNKNLLRPGDAYPDTGNPVLGSVTIFVVSNMTTYASFDDVVKKAFDVFLRLYNLCPPNLAGKI